VWAEGHVDNTVLCGQRDVLITILCGEKGRVDNTILCGKSDVLITQYCVGKGTC